jgi:nitrogen-specific signal transduction histidine kinase
MNNKGVAGSGYERLLRNAYQTEIILRLRHAVLHGLKSPSQTILSALYLLQKKASAGETGEIAKYAGWIKEAVRDSGDRAEAFLPARPDETVPCDLNVLTARVLHMLHDDAALREVEFVSDEGSGAPPIPGHRGNLQMAVTALLTGALDAAAAGSKLPISVEATPAELRWSIEVPGSMRPREADFEPRYDVEPPRSGIGWHVARGIAGDHGGTLTIDEAPGGWRASLLLPYPQL